MAKRFSDYPSLKDIQYAKKEYKPSGSEILVNYIMEKTDMGGMKDKGGKPVNMKKANSGTGKKAGG